MQVKRYNPGVRLEGRGCVVALGFFDGVHLGHRALLGCAKKRALSLGVPLLVFTFAHGGGIKAGVPLIYSERDREELFSTLGVDTAIVADFKELRDLSPEEFIEKVIIGDLGAVCAVAGYDYKFGKYGKADAADLSRLMAGHGLMTEIVDEYRAGGRTVSSSEIRELLCGGHVEVANELLGAPFFISGTVVHGRADGKGYGYPTINIGVHEGAVRLKHGVYLTAVKMGEKLYTGLTNVGECPTFGAREYHTETYLIDFDGDAYGMETKVYFLSFIREERAFASLGELKEQIAKDLIKAKDIKGDKKWQELGLN